MPFQPAPVRFDQAGGVPGEFAFDGPTRSEPGILRSVAPVNNIFGRAFSMDSAVPGIWRAGDASTDGEKFAIMTSPKQNVSAGTSAGGTLAPTLTLRNEEIAEFTDMGIVWAITQNANALVGNVIHFIKATGELQTYPPGTAVAGTNLLLPGATVVRFPQPTAGGLICIKLTN